MGLLTGSREYDLTSRHKRGEDDMMEEKERGYENLIKGIDDCIIRAKCGDVTAIKKLFFINLFLSGYKKNKE